MKIAYFEPLNRAWRRMALALFKPFDLHKWLVVGFNAFLAGLTEGHHGSGGSRARWDANFRDFLVFPQRAWEWLMNHPGWFALILFGVLLLIVVGIILLWLSSRGIFMFMDNVVQNRAEVVKPWNEFRKEGNSLFLWRLVFGLICIAGFIGLLFFFFVTAASLYEAGQSRAVPVVFIVWTALIALLLFIIVGYITMFLKDFVAPIMYKHRLTAVQAWGRFLHLCGKYPFHFLLYGIFIFILIILFVIFVIIAGVVTCCLGWLILIIPYVGTVVTLPLWYAYRAFSLEFLAQFGPEYTLLPAPESEPAPGSHPGRQERQEDD